MVGLGVFDMPVAEKDIGAAKVPAGDAEKKHLCVQVAVSVVVTEKRVVIPHGDHFSRNGHAGLQ